MGRLTVVDGPNEGTVYDLRDVCVLGRALDCQIHIQDLTVSRRHARVSLVDDRFVLEDLSSGNGTFCNEVQVNGRKILNDGDIIRVSNLRLLFEEDDEEPAPPPDSVTMIGTPEMKPHIVKTVDARKSVLDDAALLTNPAELQKVAARLKTVYAVAEAISSILDIDQLLPEIMTRLFGVFPEAERAFIMLVDEKGGSLIPKAVKRRNAKDNEEITVSRTILHEVMSKRHSVLSRDAMADARFLAGHSVANFGIRSMMCAPLVWRGETLGIVYLDSHALATFSQADLEMLSGIAGQAAAALGNAKLHGELMKRQRLEQDLRLAERIQQSFLPRKTPQIAGFTFSARYEPAFEIGGDFYDFVRLPDDRLGIVVGDVSGKGIGAALYMARMTRDLRYFALAEPDPGRVLMWMNRAVAESGQDDIFVTLIYAVLDAATGQLIIANAGHMPCTIRRRTELDIRVLDQISGMPLGVMPNQEYESETFQMQPGDTAMFFSDGLSEAMSPQKQMFGMEALQRAIGRGPSDAQSVIDRAFKAMQAHVADAPQFDDTTVVCVGRNLPGAAAPRQATRGT